LEAQLLKKREKIVMTASMIYKLKGLLLIVSIFYLLVYLLAIIWFLPDRNLLENGLLSLKPLGYIFFIIYGYSTYTSKSTSVLNKSIPIFCGIFVLLVEILIWFLPDYLISRKGLLSIVFEMPIVFGICVVCFFEYSKFKHE